jgi:uncharacterized membrane protein YedE/YeeE
MTNIAPALIDPGVITLGAALLGAVFGYASQRSHFCTMGAVADILSMGSWTRLRMWVLAMVAALLGTTGLQALGWFDPAQSVYAGATLPWLSLTVGGALFGAGMALAGGCGSKTLVRIGGGNLKSVVVFLVLALVSYMTLKGLTAVARVRWLDPVALVLAGPQDLPSLMARAGLAREGALWGLTAVLAGAGLVFALVDREMRRAEPLVASLVIGATVAAGWWLTAHVGHVMEHPQTLEEAFIGTYGNRPESLSFVAPYAHSIELLTLWSDASRHVSFGVAVLAGVVLGAAGGAWRGGEWRLESFRDGPDLLRHLAGGALMGFGGVTALGCTIGQGLSGISTLALGSFIAVAAMIAGCAAALKGLEWWTLRE